MTEKQLKLTEKQEKFRAALLGEAQGDPRAAMRIAGYSDSYKIVELLSGKLGDVVREDAKLFMALNASKAAMATVGVIDDPTAPGNREKLAAAASVLDRVGISKQENIKHEVEGSLPIFEFPAKKIPEDGE